MRNCTISIQLQRSHNVAPRRKVWPMTFKTFSCAGPWQHSDESHPRVSENCSLQQCVPTCRVGSSGWGVTPGAPRPTRCGTWRGWPRAPSPSCRSGPCCQVSWDPAVSLLGPRCQVSWDPAVRSVRILLSGLLGPCCQVCWNPAVRSAGTLLSGLY